MARLDETDERLFRNREQQPRQRHTIGGQLGGGFDVRLTRAIMPGGRLGFSFMGSFGEQIGGRRNYSGFHGTAGLGWVFG